MQDLKTHTMPGDLPLMLARVVPASTAQTLLAQIDGDGAVPVANDRDAGGSGLGAAADLLAFYLQRGQIAPDAHPQAVSLPQIAQALVVRQHSAPRPPALLRPAMWRGSPP
jgi:hypothetical protein